MEFTFANYSIGRMERVKLEDRNLNYMSKIVRLDWMR
ncbi:MAG: hypothetical protein ACD_15C00001G0001 [uncultured bacterium]|nr:MAG: hypothetical protein ACD_15C00001G0001 [uncultured bacterium]